LIKFFRLAFSSSFLLDMAETSRRTIVKARDPIRDKASDALLNALKEARDLERAEFLEVDSDIKKKARLDGSLSPARGSPKLEQAQILPSENTDDIPQGEEEERPSEQGSMSDAGQGQAIQDHEKEQSDTNISRKRKSSHPDITEDVLDLDDNTLKQLAKSIEDAVFSCYKETSKDYRLQLREIMENLTDQTNHTLRSNILIGAVSPSDIASMTVPQMADASLQQKREQEKKLIGGHQLVTDEDIGWYETTDYKCHKCDSHDCVYRHVMERYDEADSVSAWATKDRPMAMLEVRCLQCSHSWKTPPM